MNGAPLEGFRFLALLWTTALFCRRDAIDSTGVRAGFVVDAFLPPSVIRTERMVVNNNNNNNNNNKINNKDDAKGPSNSRQLSLAATRPRKFAENADGPLYVNDKCINCAACSMFAPSVFARETRSDTHHIVTKQPVSEQEIEESRAALSACPVAAIRVEQQPKEEQQQQTRDTKSAQLAINPKFNGRPLPFPRPVSPNLLDVYFVGHHNSKSFGATPYLLSATKPSNPSSQSKSTPVVWIMVDTPRYSEPAVRAVESVTGPDGPSYLVLTHVDDTADHNRWKEKYPGLKRVFHSGDLGVHNWVGDETLEDVEILLESKSSDGKLRSFDLNGNPIGDGDDDDDDHHHHHGVVLVHTPGHSPGSIALFQKPDKSRPGVLFSGDTYSYTTREGGHMSGFPQYGNDPRLQSTILPLLLNLDWKILAPGHGHVRDYSLSAQSRGTDDDEVDDPREREMDAALEELSNYFP
mmetsp:Transcript_11393/g.26415  ORF Transcript_11393/g.26415 Transcript_11393/m.26415 type:complete len:466 (-) Transcript_11393:1396-2793(-)